MAPREWPEPLLRKAGGLPFCLLVGPKDTEAWAWKTDWVDSWQTPESTVAPSKFKAPRVWVCPGPDLSGTGPKPRVALVAFLQPL